LAGALLQVLLRNPLADPYVLGTSGGAAVGALLAMLAGLSGAALGGSAFAGALLSTLLVFGIARRGGDWSPTRLLLTGIIMASAWGALIAFILTIAPEHNLRGMLFWMMGDIRSGDLPWTALLILLLMLILSVLLARPLNLLARGELQALTLGVSVRPLRATLYLLAALGTATAVTLAGSVGFVGLIIPHLLRLAGARDHRILLPASVLAGGALLLVADTLARTLWAPQQLPVGILTAAIGIPVFLFLLLRTRVEVHA
jgi:iron complex transport system permease protein